MASKKINTILSLKDKMSQPLMQVNKNVGKVTKEMKHSANQVDKWKNNSVKAMDNVIKKSAQVVGAAGLMAGAFAIKVGFGEAFDMEGYKTQLVTAVKDTKLAGELMADAVKFSNATPFETGEVVESVAKMEAYGISSKKWLADVADMAGGTNKTIDQATEAMADAVMGEWERLKEFGIKKNDLMLAAEEKYGADVVFNKKGQVIDQLKMEEILQATMRKKFKDGANASSKTTKGMWSTIKGVTKSSLAKIVGMQEDGTIKQGSVLAKLRGKMKLVTDKFLAWQKDGTINKIADNVTNGVNKIIGFIKKMIKFIKLVVNFVKKHEKLITTILIFVATLYTVIKVVGILKIGLIALKTVMMILNGTLLMSPFTWIALAIGLVVAAGYLLWRNWGAIIEWAGKLRERVSKSWDETKENIVNAVKKAWEGVKEWFGKIRKFIKNPIKGTIEVVKNIKEKNEKSKGTMERPFAKGTSYSPAGYARIHEEGGEIRKLSSGEMIIPADKSDRLLKNSSMGQGVNINVVIQGNVVGNSQFADEVGNTVYRKVKLALNNI